MPGSQVGMINLSEMLGKALGNRTKPRKVTVRKRSTFWSARNPTS